MDQSHSQEQLWGAVEIIPNRLYYAPLKFIPSESVDTDVGTTAPLESPSASTATKKEIHYFSIDAALVYWNFFLDFGPLNLGQLYRFCSLVNHKLIAPEYKDCILCYYSGPKGEQKANAAFLICAYQMLYLGRGLEEAYFGFRDDEQRSDPESMQGRNVSLPPRWRANRTLGSCGRDSERDGTAASTAGSIHNTGSSQQDSCPFARIHPIPPFHDASPIVCTYDLTVYDCLCGLDRARQLGFFKYRNTPSKIPIKTCPNDTAASPNHPSPFNVEEYEYFEQVENGDLNWIVQNKILAFAGPQSQKLITPEGFCMLTPADYIPYFLKQNVKLVIRLNKKCYDENDFEKAGIRHVQHYYLDGSCPEMRILQAVIADMESVGEGEAIAIHCKAGLGRTGTCIGAYLMKHYRLTAREVIGWMRICRPGMVIGPQQHFLQEIEGMMWQEGEVFRSNLVKSAELISAGVQQEDMPHPSILATPQTKGLHAGQHVKIVTPDTAGAGILRSSANASHDEAMTVPGHDDTTSAIPSSPSSMNSLLDVLKVDEPSSTGDDADMKEGDQANALLERKLRQNLDHQFMA